VLTRVAAPWPLLFALAAIACGGGSAPPASGPTPLPAREPVKPLATTLFAGQQVAVTPITLVIADQSLSLLAPLSDRVASLRWADSLVGEALLARGPEVKWVLPAELRKLARRSPAIAPDPDRMGQSILRAQKLDEVPDPLRGHLRSLMALAGGRFVLVPSALYFLSDPDGGVRAELALVLADTRTGRVVWRTLAWGTGPTPARALSMSLETVLPVQLQ